MGFIWASSMNGLNRFDGSHITVFQPQQNNIHSIYGRNIQSPFFENENKDIWFTTYDKSSISVYRQKTGHFDHYFIHSNEKTNEPDTYNALFLEHHHWLWVLANDNLYKFNTKAPVENNVQPLLNLQAARFAVDTFTEGFVKRVAACFWSYRKGFEIIDFDKNALVMRRRTYFSEQEKTFMPLLTVQAALIENDTLVWLTTDKGMVRLNPEQPRTFKIFHTGIQGSVIRRLAFDKYKKLYVSTNKTPLLVFDKTALTFTPLSINIKNQYDTFDPMQNGAYDIFIDNTNILWLSVEKEGIFYAPLKGKKFDNPFTLNNQLLPNINQILEDDGGGIWASTTSNLYQFDKNYTFKGISTLIPKSYLINGIDKQFWIVSKTGLLQYIDDTKKELKTVLEKKEHEFRCITQIDESTLLITSNHDLFVFNTKTKIFSPLMINRFFDNIIVDNLKNIWCGTARENIICYQINKTGNSIKKIYEINDKGIVNHFHNSTINPSVIWAATTKGVIKINTNTLNDTLFTEKDGLPDSQIQAVLEDKKGNLWCSTNHGIVRYNSITKLSRQFTVRDGLSANAYNPNAALLSSTGEMWFGSIHGIDIFHPDSIQDISQPPQLAITGLKIYDKYWQGDTSIMVAQNIHLKYFENTLTFELAAMDYTDPNNNKFKVMLEGYDREWVNLNTQNFVTYVNLPTGDYTFKFIACNTEGIWNETPRVLHITIRPPFWKTWWFITLCLLAIMALVGYIAYLRISKIIDLQELRIKLHENLHDDLGTRLTAIVMMIQTRPLNDKAAETKTLGDIKTIASSIVANMRRLVWATDADNDALSNVVQQMYTDKEILLAAVDLIINIDDTLQKFKIDGNKRYQMLSIYDEALTNINKSAEASLVIVTLKIEGTTFHMTIKDNGKGFDPNKPSKDGLLSGKQGFRNMHNRAKRISGKLTITSVLGEGTTIQLEFPLRAVSFLQRFRSFFSKSSPK